MEPTPPFDIIPRNIYGSKLEGTSKKRECRAYVVRCEAIHADTLREKLMATQNNDDHDPREGVFIPHSLRKSNTGGGKLYDKSIHSQNEYLEQVKRIEVFRFLVPQWTRIQCNFTASLHDHLMNHGLNCPRDNNTTINPLNQPKKPTDKANGGLYSRSTKKQKLRRALRKSFPLFKRGNQ
jgi:hypothetical protein